MISCAVSKKTFRYQIRTWSVLCIITWTLTDNPHIGMRPLQVLTFSVMASFMSQFTLFPGILVAFRFQVSGVRSETGRT